MHAILIVCIIAFVLGAVAGWKLAMRVAEYKLPHDIAKKWMGKK